jgi:hypothetical protein
MFTDNISMEINEQVGFWALHPFSLIGGVESGTVDTSMELVVVFLK